jgi:hypothetical protein
MDNLKFTVIRETDKLIISTRDRKRQLYQCVATEYKTHQSPKVMLTDEAFVDMLLEKLSDECKYTYEPNTGHILLSIPLIKDRLDARFELVPNQEEGEIDYKAQIKELQDEIDRLEPYEIIETHEYPKWNTLDEFRKLPGFKYIEAGMDWRSHLRVVNDSKKEESKRDRFFKCNDMYVGFRKPGTHNIQNQTETGTGIIGDPFCKWTTIIDESSDNDLNKVIGYVLERYKRSVVIICRDIYLSVHIRNYMLDYLRGWIILNLNLLIGRQAYYEIHIDKNRGTVKIIIKRLKNPIFTFDCTDIIGDDKISLYKMHTIPMKLFVDTGVHYVPTLDNY